MTLLLQTIAIQQGHLSQGSTQANALTHVATINCVQCGEGHSVEVCPLNQQPVYSIYNESLGNTYNPGWRNHPTFSWGGNHNQGGQGNHQNSYHGNRGNPPVFINQDQSPDLTINDDQSTTNKRITSSEESTSTKDESQQDSNAKSIQPPAPKTQQTQDLNEQLIEQKVQRDPPPFPSMLRKKYDSKQFQRFLDVLRQLHINIPLIEALEQMPSYVKFLKDILTNKRKIGENETVALTYECSALFQNSIPTKMKDPESFTLPCSIGGKEVKNALCDLGASINLMPLSIFKKLHIDKARPTTVTLQLTDRSITHPEGKIKDVLVQVDKFIFPADFIILDYEADREVPIILGHLFLATGRALIDVQKGELTIKVDDQQVKFNVLNALKYPGEMENCQYVEELQDDYWHEPQEEPEEEDFEIDCLAHALSVISRYMSNPGKPHWEAGK
ncbi:uncharacterized protein LOC120076255 [Benincasa hispida]|uniref:uncharacterized protein LOC120076255 n=1 Tax=Benincasa hispida TaxID=102211 RepID=UPI0019014D8A|nr:uncharacterized protein LOC120076255 [Benincasa hispida]